MATWAPLRELLSKVDDSMTLTWKQLDELVGGLPPSANQYPAFFAGDRPSWAGFRTRNVQLGRQVTFERVTQARRTPATGTSEGTSKGNSAQRVEDDLVLRAAAATGVHDRDSLVQEGLETLIRLASARQLAAIGGTDPTASSARRRRGGAK